MKKPKLVLVISLLAVLVVTLTALVVVVVLNTNSPIKNCDKNIKSSMNIVSSIETNVTMTDTDVVVYQYVKEIVLENGNASIETNTSTLGNSFALETKTTNETIENFDRSTLVNVNLKEDSFISYKLENEVLEATIDSEHIGEVFNNENLTIDGQARLVITFDDKKVLNVTCTFKTLSNKDVVISIDYNY